jgi:hypothetical protein
MSPEQPDLANLQRWMQEVVVHQGTIDEAVASPEAEQEIPAERLGEVVLPSHSLSAAERVGIYHGMHLMRMEEALATDYPVIRHFLGAAEFDELVHDYVARYPSRSYTLNRLGDHLPRFLNDRPDWSTDGFLTDLARLELAMTEVFDEQESPALTGEDLEAVDPERWETSHLEPIAALRLLSLNHVVIPHLKAYHRERPCPNTVKQPSWVAVYRRDYSVLRLELKLAEHDLLRDLINGVALGDALAAAMAGGSSAHQQARVFRWFRTWIREGLFQRLTIS